jgi:ATP-dependent DNA helicase Q1
MIVVYVLVCLRLWYLVRQRCSVGAKLVRDWSTRQMSYASGSHEDSYITKQRLNGELASIDAEIVSINEDIDRLTALRLQLEDRKQAVRRELAQHDVPRQQLRQITTNLAGKTPSNNRIDYSEEFEWSASLRGTMKRVFGIQDFRLCQEG